METNIRKVIDFLGSKRFFGATVLIFTLEAFWLAITSRFPMAFDEAYHLGLIQFFSHRWNPLITSQPPSTYKYGAIVHDPSWLYHYLMSFPYRFMELFTHNIVVLVMGMRLIDVAFMVVNLFILRKLLRLVVASRPLTNIVLFVFAFTPMVTVLSAQISYDNLVIPLTTLCLYETILLVRELNRRYFNVYRFLFLLCLCLMTSLVKFTFLPIFLVITIVIAWKLISYWRANRRKLLGQMIESFSHSSSFFRGGVLAMTTLSVLLFGWFYGINTIRYHNPVPRCNQVISNEACRQNYSWNGSYVVRQYHQAHPGTGIHLSIVQFTTTRWAFFMSEQLYGFIVPIQGLSGASVPLLSLTIMLFSAAIVCLAIVFKVILKNYSALIMLILISFVYMLFLWGYNYWTFLQNGYPAAINGRYLVPVLAYLYAISGLSVSLSLKRSSRSGLSSLSLAAIVIIVFVVFGGFSQYVKDVTPNYGWLSSANGFVLQSFGP